MIATLAGSLLGVSAPRAGAGAGVPPRPAGGAVMVGWHEKGDNLDALRAHEAQLGTRFAVVRVYQQWRLPGRKVGTLIDEGRLVLVSHKPPATGGWAAVASGAEDEMIAALADRYRSYGAEVLFVFHHEPHDNASDLKGGTSGKVADYLGAWRRIHAIFVERGAHRSAGGNVYFAYSATGSWALARSGGGAPGSGDVLYPGDGIIDVFAHDRYNWASCRGDDWEEFADNWSPLVALAAAHHKPLIIGEFGSPPAGGGRNDWFRRAAGWMRTDPLARQWLWGFAYFHSLHDTCPWDFLNQGDDGLGGWREGFSDPYFTGTPFSLAPAGGAPAPGIGLPPAPEPAPPSEEPPLTPTTRPAPTTTTTRSAPVVPPPAGPGPVVPSTTSSTTAPAASQGEDPSRPAGPVGGDPGAPGGPVDGAAGQRDAPPEGPAGVVVVWALVAMAAVAAAYLRVTTGPEWPG